MQQPPMMPTFPAQVQRAPALGPHWVMLRIVAVLLKILGALLIPLGLLGSFALLIYLNDEKVIAYHGWIAVVASFVPGVGALIATLLLWAMADLIMLLVAIENNTRYR